MPGIDDSLIGQGEQDLAHGMEHDHGIAVAAASDEQCVARENGRMIPEQPADAAHGMARREQRLDI